MPRFMRLLNAASRFSLSQSAQLARLRARFCGTGASLRELLQARLLSWINYRWLKQGVATLARLSTAQAKTMAETEKAHVPASVYLKFLGRYALLIAAAYAILRSFKLPAASLLAGLFAVIAAVILEMLGQLFRSGPSPRADT